MSSFLFRKKKYRPAILLYVLTSLRGCNQGKKVNGQRTVDSSIPLVRLWSSLIPSRLGDVVERFHRGRGLRYHAKSLCRSREERTHSEGKEKARLGTRAGRVPRNEAPPRRTKRRKTGRVELYPPKRACHSQAAESISLYSRINDNIIFQRSRWDASAPWNIARDNLLGILANYLAHFPNYSTKLHTSPMLKIYTKMYNYYIFFSIIWQWCFILWE